MKGTLETNQTTTTFDLIAISRLGSARPTNIHPFDETASDSALTDSIHSHRQQQHQLTRSDLGGLRFVSFSNPSTLDLITTETKANRPGSVRFNSVWFGFSCCGVVRRRRARLVMYRPKVKTWTCCLLGLDGSGWALMLK